MKSADAVWRKLISAALAAACGTTAAFAAVTRKAAGGAVITAATSQAATGRLTASRFGSAAGRAGLGGL